MQHGWKLALHGMHWFVLLVGSNIALIADNDLSGINVWPYRAHVRPYARCLPVLCAHV